MDTIIKGRDFEAEFSPLKQKKCRYKKYTLEMCNTNQQDSWTANYDLVSIQQGFSVE